jgi:ammonia channel protein AmtB
VQVDGHREYPHRRRRCSHSDRPQSGQLKYQAIAALFIIVLNAVATFVILKIIGIFVPLRMNEKLLLIGDMAVHGEEA